MRRTLLSDRRLGAKRRTNYICLWLGYVGVPKACAVPTGLVTSFAANPALKRWAKLGYAYRRGDFRSKTASPKSAHPTLNPLRCCVWSRSRRRLQRFAQEAGWPFGNVVVADKLRIQPLNYSGIAQALGIVGEIVRDDGDHVEALLELKAQRGVVLLSFDDRNHVVLRLQPACAMTIPAQSRTGADAQQLMRLGQAPARGVDFVADAMMLQRGIDNDLRPVQRTAAMRIVIGEHAVSGESLPVVERLVIFPVDNQAGAHADNIFLRAMHRDELALGEDAEMRRKLFGTPRGGVGINARTQFTDCGEITRLGISYKDGLIGSREHLLLPYRTASARRYRIHRQNCESNYAARGRQVTLVSRRLADGAARNVRREVCALPVGARNLASSVPKLEGPGFSSVVPAERRECPAWIVMAVKLVNNRTRSPYLKSLEEIMKVARSLLPILIAVVMASTSLLAQQKPVLSPPGEASVKFDDGKTVAIKYSRPSMRGRKIFGELVPYGKVWRTGANSATSLTTDTTLDIGGTTVPAGNYTLYTVPGEKSWELIVNKQTGQWGTNYDQGQDLARIPMKVSQLPSGLEIFTISLDRMSGKSATLKLEWELTSASVNLTEK